MEKAQAEQELHVGSWFVGDANRVIISKLEVDRLEVAAHALRRLLRHLDAGLQDAHWKRLRWHTCEPEAELRVRLLRVKFLHDQLEIVHPTGTQVAVLQQDPCPLGDTFFNHARGDGSLPLAERDRLGTFAHAHLSSKLEKVLCGIASAGEHENERGNHEARVEAFLHVEWRWLDETLPHVLDDEVLDRLDQFVWPKRAEHDHLLHIPNIVPLARKGRLVTGFRVEECLPVIQVIGKVVVEPTQRLEGGEGAELAPRLVSEPFLGRSWLGQAVIRHLVRLTGQQESPLLGIDQVVALHDLDAQIERE
mmetsp:Transcript_6084/g.17014  ORF Transcript_6084/g.17014 Transcript_6084/m.17014 type:complete len:307 (-) Transcript_6084:1329-2249(-)